MGDFDRVQESGAKSESKKMGMLAVLGLVLVGVLVFHFAKQGPQVASASSGATGAPMGASRNETPEVVLNALQIDPTAELLTKAAVDDPIFAEPPRNPFRMSPTWLSKLTKPKEIPHETIKPQVDPVPNSTVYKPLLVPLKIEDYKLNLIFTDHGKATAIINNKQVTVGMLVDKARVVDISSDGVTLQNTESPDAPVIRLSQQPQMK